jgi:hypothetical protein
MRYTFLFYVLFTQTVIAQHGIVNYQSFSIENKEVVWAQVYHQDDSVKNISPKLFEHLKRKVWIKNIHYEGNDILADLTEYRPDYKRYGGKYLNTSSITRTGRWKGKVHISFKEGKYRVALYGLNYDAKKSATGSGKATIEQHDVSGTLGEFVLNNFRSSFKKSRMKDLDILHFSFKDSFVLTFDQVIDSDW